MGRRSGKTHPEEKLEPMTYRPASSLEEVIERMHRILEPLVDADDQRRHFHATYMRTMEAVEAEINRGGFRDPAWVERWDVRFADLYLEAFDAWEKGARPSRPWLVAFEASREPRIAPLRHVLLGMNAHINLDLPQALVATITDEEFDDQAVLARRSSDHVRIDDILMERVSLEDRELVRVERRGDRTLLDRLLMPLNRRATKRFIREARTKVWANACLLNVARRAGPEPLQARLVELEEMSARRVADLRAPGQVAIRLAIGGFGVRLREA